MLELKGLTYQVGDNGGQTDILRGIDLTIQDNAFVVITGPNGGGKTTLAKTIMGLVKPTGGQILWNGTDITALSITERAKLGISYGFQQPPGSKGGLKVQDLLGWPPARQNSPRTSAVPTSTGWGCGGRLYRPGGWTLPPAAARSSALRLPSWRPSGLLIFDEPEAGSDL